MGYFSKQRTARDLGNMGRGRSGRPSHGILWEEDNTGGGITAQRKENTREEKERERKRKFIPRSERK